MRSRGNWGNPSERFRAVRKHDVPQRRTTVTKTVFITLGSWWGVRTANLPAVCLNA